MSEHNNPPGTFPNKGAATALAVLGTVCWCVQLIPQAIKNYRAKSTAGLDTLFIFSWVIASVPLSVYNLVQDLNIALKIQPELFQLLSLVTFFQCLIYGEGWSARKSFIVVGALAALSAGLQAMLILTIQLGMRRHVEWPVTLMGVLATILVNIGFLPQYIQIFRQKTVRGISYIFLIIDSAGALLSFISLPFDRWDVLAAIDYGLVFVLEMGIFALVLIFNVILGKKSKAYDENEETQTRDDEEEEEKPKILIRNPTSRSDYTVHPQEKSIHIP
ncbi:plasma membrane basic amino acid transmembrane transporter [Schizosaccharomyces osmophilus]|uniref:Plasma membrane basic amino acid transmembrane transporter n=1 Tax=Schizosaccharomyces osmophilus TaxID=2545709 RepID=A0AAE9WEM4_9SCHI|nr:plasma membrane basic amino acid transmembrane transporter [Schizosaccharomyces osmophilus]WBW73812.1 plasma membrane basic amino acid transmembrane transporter [Schizosaccharomyces osmophilus]